ncbi:MAG: restriction endonuclease subunit M [Ruminococcus sp.]|nr:restriction endonuclease subunit M [Ruminococcus sp.]
MDSKLLELLLADNSTKRNIVWATDDYREYGELYSPECEITTDLVTGIFSDVIRPRFIKVKEKQNYRTRNKAEVFTPLWICNQQNNLVDEKWFGRPDIFNTADGKTWTANKSKIEFSDKSWQDYVNAKRMEITCGEAPYLVSRYDTVTGNMIADVNERIGLLDRKLRVVNENTDNEKDWFEWVKKAYQSTYGYEYQGDNLLIARLNLLFTFTDNMHYKFDREPTNEELKNIAYIISWNIWQMDGLNYTSPYRESEQEEDSQLAFFGFEEEVCIEKSVVLCLIRDWTSQKTFEFRSLVKKG